MKRIKGKRVSEIEGQLKGLECEELYIPIPLSKALAFRILSKVKGLKVIFLSPSSMRRTSKSVIEALEQVGVKVFELKVSRGRPRKYDKREEEKVGRLAKMGIKAREIAKKTGIPLRSVYLILERVGLKRRA